MKNRITSNVLKDISKRLNPSTSNNSIEQVLIVFNGSNMDIWKKLDELQKIKKQGIDISLAFSFMAEHLLDIEKIRCKLSPKKIYKEDSIFELEDIIRRYSYIIAPNITINTLSKISLGLIDSLIPNLLWTFLYQGKKVYVDLSSVRKHYGKETENKEIKSQIDKRIERLINMGAIELKDEYRTKNHQMVEGSSTINTRGSFKDIQQTEEKRLITEKDIINMERNSKILIKKGWIITPLARDKAREKNINIDKI